jgi:hypothetical protein
MFDFVDPLVDPPVLTPPSLSQRSKSLAELGSVVNFASKQGFQTHFKN